MPSAEARSFARMNVRAAVLDLLRAFGMTSIFGNPGSTELPLFRDFPNDFRYVLGLQEAVVVGMADGYAQATHNAAFVNLHSAAGVGHAMGNIFTAFRNRTPLVIAAGQQARSILPYDPFLFSAQATELPKPYVKWSAEPARAEDVPLAIARAYYIAMQPPRGPVLVSIPADDWAKPCEPVAARVVSTEIRPEPRVLDAIGEALDVSLRPAFVVGRGGRSRRRLERRGAARRTAQRGGVGGADVGALQLPRRSSALCRVPSPDAREDRQSSCWTRCHLCAGRRRIHLPRRRRRTASSRGRRLVQLIDDPNIAAWTPQGTSAMGSIRLGVLDLLAREAPRPRVRPVAAPPAAARRAFDTDSGSLRFADAGRFPRSRGYRRRGSAERAAGDAELSADPAQRNLLHDVQRRTRLRHAGGRGDCAGKPDAKVIGLIGDGSSMYSIQALWSAAQLALPITFIVLKNRRYAVLQEFAPTFGFGPASRWPAPSCPYRFRGAGARDGMRWRERRQRARSLRDALMLRSGRRSFRRLLKSDVA